MNAQMKRYRQTSIFESFEFIKRQKKIAQSNNMNEEMRMKILAATERRLSPVKDTKNSLNAKPKEIKDNSIFEGIEIDPLALASCSTEETIVSDDESSFQNSAEIFPDLTSSEECSSAGHSAELFPDTKESESQSLSDTEAEDEDANEAEEQVDMSLLNRSPLCNLSLPKLEPLENHSIMFSPHIRPGDAPRPFPAAYRDKWDSDHVRMPCSASSKYPVENVMGEKRIESRWDLICRSLKQSIRSSKDLEEAVMMYNKQYIEKWNFRGLHAFINKCLTHEEKDNFFKEILPAMIEVTLKLPKICTQPPPLLKKRKDHYLTLSQKQIGCLLLNAFFCTFPRRNHSNKHAKHRWTNEYAYYPDINFNRLFASPKYEISARNAEKLKCLFNYFRRITVEEPSGTVTFHRQCLSEPNLPIWHESTRGIRTAVIRSSGLIETEGAGMLQVDFANKFVGGGVLGQGCVQEEIRFIICPELIVSRLFVESLDFNEVLIVTGVEQYNKYSGYSDTFKWEGNFSDRTARDSWGRMYTQLVAMDATHFINPTTQFKSEFIKKELNKAYCGFYENAQPTNLSAVATGNWGCGAFKGNANLKFLIQLMAASQAGRSLLYFTFGNKKLKTELQRMYDFLNDQNLTVGDVWRLLIQYAKNVSLHNAKYCSMYDFIYSQCVFKGANYRTDKKLLNDSNKMAAEKHIENVTCEDSSTETEYSNS